jgi:hypothetical protein
MKQTLISQVCAAEARKAATERKTKDIKLVISLTCREIILGLIVIERSNKNKDYYPRVTIIQGQG